MSEAKLPEPFAYANQDSLAWLASRRDHRRALIDTLLSVHPRGDTQEPIYTAAEIQAAYQAGRDAALEEVAGHAQGTSVHLANAIRALKGPQP